MMIIHNTNRNQPPYYKKSWKQQKTKLNRDFCISTKTNCKSTFEGIFLLLMLLFTAHVSILNCLKHIYPE